MSVGYVAVYSKAAAGGTGGGGGAGGGTSCTTTATADISADCYSASQGTISKTSATDSVTGTHDVYLEFSSGAAGNPPFVSLHWFSFPAH